MSIALHRSFQSTLKAMGIASHVNLEAVANHTFEDHGIAQLATRPYTGIDIDNDRVLRTTALAVGEDRALFSASAGTLIDTA
jgi:hypothetical protein